MFAKCFTKNVSNFARHRPRPSSQVSRQFRLLSTTPPTNPSPLDDSSSVTPPSFDPYDTTTTTIIEPSPLSDLPIDVLIDPHTSPNIWPLTDNAIWLVQTVHETGGVPWFAAIAGTTFCIRLLLVPLAVKSMKNASKLAEVQPEMNKLKERMEAARSDEEKQAHAKEMREFMSKKGVNPFSTFLPILAQMPIFMSFFFGLQRMADEYPTLINGGALWFEDLTVADPTYGLPILSAMSFLLVIELGGEAGQGQGGNEGQRKIMKNVMRGLAVAMVPITMSMPASVFMYWVTSNLFSGVQTAAFQIPAVKNVLGIPTIVPQASVPNIQSVKTSPSNFSTNMQNIAPPPPPLEGMVTQPEEDHINTGVQRRQRKHKRKQRQSKRK
tara:strand:- start:166 stop:1311 length:1146 start_codon:yes stop_codon:yes gene_type:complete